MLHVSLGLARRGLRDRRCFRFPIVRLPGPPPFFSHNVPADEGALSDSLGKSVGLPEDPDKVAALQAQTGKDLDVFSSRPMARTQMDTIYGRGNWRMMRRFVIWQCQHGKWCCVDDVHFSGHSDAVSNAERVHAAGPAWAAAVARHFRVMAHLIPTLGHLPVLTGCCDDKKSAFRWKEVREADRCLSIVAYWVSKRRRVMCVQLWGHSFSLSSAAHTYCGDPEFVQAVHRTLLFSPCIHFYDDRFSIDWGLGKGPAQTSYLECAPCWATCWVQKTRGHVPYCPVHGM